MKYAILTAVHTDAENLARLGACISAEPAKPLQWLILHEGGDAATRAVAEGFAHALPFAKVLDFATRRAPVRGGAVARLLERGIERLAPPVELVININADVSFDPGSLATLVEAFTRDPQLGIASGIRVDQYDGRRIEHVASGFFVEAQCRAYRLRCLRELLPFEKRLGWDAVDVAQAVLRNWRTATVGEMSFVHHRPIGARDGSRRAAHRSEGETAWYLGYRPSYLALRALRSARLEMSALYQTIGYVVGATKREPRAPAVVRSTIRDNQTMRCLFRRVIFPTTPGARSPRIDVLLTADPGGHLHELLALKPVWSTLSRAWAIPQGDRFLASESERVHVLVGPTRRSARVACKNFVRAYRILRDERPYAVLAAGAGGSVPVVWAAWLMGIPAFFIENSGRLDTTSRSRRLVRPFVERCYVQWPDLDDGHKKTVYAGSILFHSR